VAQKREGIMKRDEPEKTSHFLFGGEDKSTIFVVPKAK
jgi:hypothetical protein